MFVIFSILDLVQQKVNGLGTSPRNQFRDYHTWNRIEKLMPQHWNFAPQTLKTLQKTTNLFSNLDFCCRNLGFPKPWICPWIFHGGRRPTKNVGGCGGGGSPPHEEANVPPTWLPIGRSRLLLGVGRSRLWIGRSRLPIGRSRLPIDA